MGRSARYQHVEFYLKRYCASTNRVLEIGCGSAPYRDLFSPGQFLGTDVINPHYQDPGDVDVFCSANALPFRGHTFDVVFSQAAIDYMPNLMQVLRETFRVLRPGGRMLVFTYDLRTLERIHRESQNASHQAHVHYSVFTESQFVSWLRQTGYRGTWLPMRLPTPHQSLKRLLVKAPLVEWFRRRRNHWRIFLAEKPA